MPDIEIIVDDLPVPVDAEEYERDPQLVIDSVRRARSYVRMEYYAPLTERWRRPNPAQADDILANGPNDSNLHGWSLK